MLLASERFAVLQSTGITKASLKLYNRNASNSDPRSSATKTEETARRESSPRFVGTKTITHFPVPEEVKAITRRAATTRTLVGMAAPVVARQSDSAPDSAKVFDLYASGSRRASVGAASPAADANRETRVRDVAGSDAPAKPNAVTLAELLDSATERHAATDALWPQGLHLIQRVLSGLEQSSALNSLSGRPSEFEAQREFEAPRETEAPSATSARVALDASRIEVDVTGTVRILDDVEDGPEAAQVVSTWLYRLGAGRYPTGSGGQRPSRFNRALPKWVDGVCAKGLSNDAADRYANLRELANDLDDYAPPPSRLDVSKWVNHVLRGAQPTEVELAGELGDALTQFTYSPKPTRWLAWFAWLLVIGITLCVTGWFVYEALLT